MSHLRNPNLFLFVGLAMFVVSLFASILLGSMVIAGFLLASAFSIYGLLQRTTRSSGPRSYKLWPLGVYLLVWIVFTTLRAFADDIGFPDQGQLAAAIDRMLGLGVTPTERAQSAFYTPGEVGILDRIGLLIHGSYFMVPHLLALCLWFSKSPRIAGIFAAYLRTTALVLGFGLVLYVLVPTSPPWLQSGEYGPLELERLVWSVQVAQDPGGEQVYGVIRDPNPIAAMPSLHTAITVLLAWVAWTVHRRLGIAFTAYAVLMGAALVYMGEHFVVDVAAGALLTAGVVALERRYAASSETYRNFGFPRRSIPDPQPTLVPGAGVLHPAYQSELTASSD